MNNYFTNYLNELSNRLWVKPNRKKEILQEIQNHLETMSNPSKEISKEDLISQFGTPRELAMQINRSVHFKMVELPKIPFFLVALGFPALNIGLWFFVQIVNHWIFGLSAPAMGNALIIYVITTVLLILGGTFFAAKLGCPPSVLYFIALIPAIYHSLFGLLTVFTSRSYGHVFRFLKESAPQIFILSILGIFIAFVVCRLFRYPKDEWHLKV
jgi:hypothetical protein